MVNSFFKNLYRKKQGDIDQLEDFLTEILAFNLNNDEGFLTGFLRLLRIELENQDISDFHVRTQKFMNFTNNECDAGIVDLYLRFSYKGVKYHIIVENKVDSTEGDRQLERYYLQLLGLTKHEGRGILVYLTKNLEKASIVAYDRIPFVLLRWRDIHSILSEADGYPPSVLREEFRKYLEVEKMTMDPVFSPEEIMSMNNMKGLIDKMNEVLDGIGSNLSEIKMMQGKSVRLTQLRYFDRFVNVTQIIPEQYTIFIGFFIEHDQGAQYPYVGSLIEVNSRHNISKEVIPKLSAFASEHQWKRRTMKNFEQVYSFTPMNEIMSVQDHFHEITEFLNQKEKECVNYLTEYDRISENLLKS